jgi:hypothetical protein
VSGPVPIHQIAVALDIIEVRRAPLKGLEAALVTTPERGAESILVNSASSVRRQRLSIAHELGHFLNPWHKPAGPFGGFACRPEDLTSSRGNLPPTTSRHKIQEAEANRFAIELLAPEKLVRPYLRGIPDLASVLRLAKALELSREAAARRYAELHPQPTALVFSAGQVVRYVDRHRDFPFVSCWPGQRLSELPSPADESGLSDHEQADLRDWLARPCQGALVIQTLSQHRGYAITLLAFDCLGAASDNGGL